MRGREQKRPGTVVEEVDQVVRAADVPAERADGFGERSDLSVHAPVNFEMVNRTPAVAAKNARGVSVVDHHDGAILFGQIAEPGQRADVAIHGENAVAYQQLPTRLLFHAGQ